MAFGRVSKEVHAGLLNLTKSQQVIALKIQLCFRKNVLQQSHPDKTVFQFSDKSHGTYSVNKLRDHLTQLVEAAWSVSDTTVEQTRKSDISLVGKRISHAFLEEGVIVLYTGVVISQVPGFPEWYNTVYDNEPDYVYTYKLLDDYTSGDLKIIL